MSPDILRYTAFSADASGGNRAGVVLDASTLSAPEMQDIAAQLNYSESAFVTGPITAAAPVPIRYFAPDGEVPFCGHATIATAAALAEHGRPGRYELSTAAGPVIIEASVRDGLAHGALLSPPVGSEPLAPEHLDELLAALRWRRGDLHPDYAPAIGLSGNRHPVLVVSSLERLADLDYDFATLQRLSRAHNWITVQLVTPTGPSSWRARNPFPYGGVIEDPATGSAAAAFVGYLRDSGRLAVGQAIAIEQGVEMGRPSLIDARAVEARALISGTAVAVTA